MENSQQAVNPISKNMKVIFLLITATLLCICSHAESVADTSVGITPTFEDAHAWNITIEKNTFIKDAVHQDVVFSRDFSKFAYCTSGQKPNGVNYWARLIIRSTEDGNVIKSVELPVSNLIGWEPHGKIAWSPDEKKIIIIWDLSRNYDHLISVDLSTSKVISIYVEEFYSRLGDVERVIWPDASKLQIFGKWNPFEYDLDNLKLRDLPKGSINYDAYKFDISRHKNCSIKFQMDPNEQTVLDLLVSEKNFPYAQVLTQTRSTMSGMGFSSSCINSPDLKYIYQQGSLIKLGLRPTPMLKYEIKGLEQTLSQDQKQSIINSFTANKPIWLKVYGKKINPLNDRLIGPDSESLKGMGVLIQIDPKWKFQFTFENKSVGTGDIVSSPQIEPAPDWGYEAWGELVNAGEGSDSGMSAIQVQNQTATMPPTAVAQDNESTNKPAPKSPVEILDELVPDATLFNAQSIEFSYSYDKVWSAIASILSEQKENVNASNKDAGLLGTALTRHGVLFPTADRYFFIFERTGDSSTKVTFKLLKYYYDISTTPGSFKPDRNDFADKKAKAFLAEIAKRLKKN